MSAWIVRIPLLITLGLATLGAFMPSLPLWGINHLAFYPLLVRLLALAIMVAAFIPAVQRGVIKVAKSLHRHGAARPRATEVAVVVIALLAVVVFTQFRSATYVLGDGQLIANTLQISYAADSTQVGPTLRSIVTKEQIAPGASMLYFLGSRVHGALMGGPAVDTVHTINAILGGLLLLTLLHAAMRAGIPLRLRVWLLVITLTCGAMQFYFGYVEFYPPFFFFGLLYVLSAIAVMHRVLPIAIAIVLCGLAAYTHIEGALLMPSLLFLILWRLWTHDKPRVMVITAIVLVVLTFVGATFAGMMTVLGEYFLPLTGAEDGYSVLSFAHGLDIVNELLLLCPLLLLVLFASIRIVAARRDDDDDRSSWSTLSDWLLIAVIIAPTTVYLLFFDPEIGFNRDWDLFAVTALGLLPLAALILERFFARESTTRYFPSSVVTATVLATVLVTSWFGVNASAHRSLLRFEKLLAYDDRLAAYNYENLGRAYWERGYQAEGVAALERVCEISPNPRTRYLLAIYYYEYGDQGASEVMLRKVLVQRPGYTDVRENLLQMVFLQSRFEDTIDIIREGQRYDPDNPRYKFYLGMSLARTGQPEAGRQALLEARASAPSPAVLGIIASELERIDKMLQQNTGE